MPGRRPPAGLVGILRLLQPLVTPTLPASEADRSLPLGCRETSSPMGSSSAVLAPPTGNGVLNQIPAGDSRESSREQAVPDDGAPLHRSVIGGGRETISPSPAFHGLGGRAASLTHQKKKKKSGMKWTISPRVYSHEDGGRAASLTHKKKRKKSGMKWRTRPLLLSSSNWATSSTGRLKVV